MACVFINRCDMELVLQVCEILTVLISLGAGWLIVTSNTQSSVKVADNNVCNDTSTEDDVCNDTSTEDVCSDTSTECNDTSTECNDTTDEDDLKETVMSEVEVRSRFQDERMDIENGFSISAATLIEHYGLFMESNVRCPLDVAEELGCLEKPSDAKHYVGISLAALIQQYDLFDATGSVWNPADLDVIDVQSL